MENAAEATGMMFIDFCLGESRFGEAPTALHETQRKALTEFAAAEEEVSTLV